MLNNIRVTRKKGKDGTETIEIDYEKRTIKITPKQIKLFESILREHVRRFYPELLKFYEKFIKENKNNIIFFYYFYLDKKQQLGRDITYAEFAAKYFKDILMNLEALSRMLNINRAMFTRIVLKPDGMIVE